MMARTHAPIGVITAIGLSSYLNLHVGPVFLASAVLGSILPDADCPQGMLNQKVLASNTTEGKLITYGALAIASGYMYFKYSNLEFLIYMIPLFIIIAIAKHRGITHSIIGVGITAFSIYNVSKNIGINYVFEPFMIGYIMHLVADYFTNNGIEIVYPIKKRYKFPITISTNGTIENGISMLAGIACIYLYISSL